MKITTVTEREKFRTVYTEYFKSDFERTDHWVYAEGQDSSHFTTVKDLSRAQVMSWHSGASEYIVTSMNQPPAAPKPPATDGPELIISTRTIDTGERKIFFGQLARHLITEESRHWSDSPSMGSDSKTTVDGWYVDPEVLPASKEHPVCCVMFLSDLEPRITMKHTGPQLSGVAMFQKQTSTQLLPDGSTQLDETTTQVIEWVEGPLSDDLFCPPDGWIRQPQLSS